MVNHQSVPQLFNKYLKLVLEIEMINVNPTSFRMFD